MKIDYRKILSGLDPAGTLTLLALVVIIALLWNTWLLYPLKVLVVFFHELAHGAMAVLTGGSIDHIRVFAGEGGYIYTNGGNSFLILSSGYLGSLVFGGAILLAAARLDHDEFITFALGAMLGLATLLFVRPIFSFGFLFCALASGALVLAGMKLPEKANDLLLKIIGLTSCLYAVLDIKSDILDRPNLHSDARMLAEMTGIPTILWGLVWSLISIFLSVFFLVLASRVRRRVHRDEIFMP